MICTPQWRFKCKVAGPSVGSNSFLMASATTQQSGQCSLPVQVQSGIWPTMSLASLNFPCGILISMYLKSVKAVRPWKKGNFSTGRSLSLRIVPGKRSTQRLLRRTLGDRSFLTISSPSEPSL